MFQKIDTIPIPSCADPVKFYRKAVTLDAGYIDEGVADFGDGLSIDSRLCADGLKGLCNRP